MLQCDLDDGNPPPMIDPMSHESLQWEVISIPGIGCDNAGREQYAPLMKNKEMFHTLDDVSDDDDWILLGTSLPFAFYSATTEAATFIVVMKYDEILGVMFDRYGRFKNLRFCDGHDALEGPTTTIHITIIEGKHLCQACGFECDRSQQACGPCIRNGGLIRWAIESLREDE